MLTVTDGVAWADGGGKGSSHSTTHDPDKAVPSPSHHHADGAAPAAGSPVAATKASAATKALPPATSRSATVNSVTVSSPSVSSVAASPAVHAQPSVTAAVKAATTAPAVTPRRAVNAPTTPSPPSAPLTPLTPDAATVAALGEEVQRKSATSVQLSPGYLVNSVINTVAAALAGAAAPLSSALANDVLQTAQFTRQMVGLGSDAGSTVASLVNNVAALAAHTVTRNLLWGLPYNALNAVATFAGDVSKILNGTPLNISSSGPFAVDYGVANALGILTPWLSPPGANDPSITVTAAHPLPIILLNGTANTQDTNWSVGAPALADAGYKVYTFNFGNVTGDPNFPIQATGDIAHSAQQLSDEVDAVLTETGASQVILIGHSQGGGILPEYYINNLGGASKVSQLIGIAPSNHGTNIDGLTGLLSIPIIGPLFKGLIAQGGSAFLQQIMGSLLVQQVYGNGDTRPGVIYDTITTLNDEVVTPYTQQALSGPNVTNIILQQQDPGFIAGHGGVVGNYEVWQDILGMLAANPAASPQPAGVPTV